MIQEHDTATAQMPTPGAGPQMRMVEMALIVASKTNPRKTFNEVKLQELAASIKASGVHQPVLLRPLPGSRLAETFEDRTKGAPLPEYELICGERRWRGSTIAEKAEIPAMIRELNDDQVLEIQIIENLQRDDLSELEEAEGYEALMEHSKINADDVAAKIGKSRSYVYGRLKLLDLCSNGRKALREGKMDASKALLIARIPDQKLQIEATEEITREDFQGSVMSYRAAAKMIQEQYMLRLDKAKFPIADADLQPGAGPCGSCPKRTGHQPELFADVKSADVCTDPTCYKAKEAAHNARVIEAARAKGQTVIAADESQDLMHEHSGWSGETKFKGYRRLDRVDDSPTDKPLRKILEKVMQAEGITAVMIENPRKPGELEACLPNETVSRLLKQAEGQAQAAKAVSKEVKEVLDAKKAKAEAKAKQRYESEWRRLLIARCWQNMEASESASFHTQEVHQFLARRTLNNLTPDDDAAICRLLDLGKVSPTNALRDHIKESAHPDHLTLLLIAQHDSSPNDCGNPYSDRRANEGMYLVAEAVLKDTAQKVIQEVQASAAALFLAKPEPLPPVAPEVASTPTPAAHADDSARKGKKRKPPAAPAGDHAGRVSAAEAMANIAAAMQEAEGSNPGAAQAAQGDEPGPVAGALGQAGGANEAGADVNTGATGEVGPGATVRINGTVPKHQVKFIGKTGQVVRVMGDGSCWWVVFTGMFKAQASFHITELDLVADAPAGDAAPGADEPAADIEPAAAEQASAAPTLEAGQLVRVKATTINKKWRGREVTVMSCKTKDAADTDPIWAVRHGTPPKHVDGQFFASDLEPVDQEAAS